MTSCWTAVESPKMANVRTNESETAEAKIVYGYIDMFLTPDANEVQHMYEINQSTVTIGRDHRCNIRINNLRVSRHQCDVVQDVKGKGRFQAVLYNRTDRPTTFVAGKELSENGKVQLIDGCRFKVHDKELRWRLFNPKNPSGQLDPNAPTTVMRLSAGGDIPPNKPMTSSKKSTRSSFSGGPSPAKHSSPKGNRRRSNDVDMRKAVLQKSFRKSVKEKSVVGSPDLFSGTPHKTSILEEKFEIITEESNNQEQTIELINLSSSADSVLESSDELIDFNSSKDTNSSRGKKLTDACRNSESFSRNGEENVDGNIQNDEVEDRVNKAGDKDDASMAATQTVEDNTQELQDNIVENIRKDEVTIDQLDFFAVDNQVEKTGNQDNTSVEATQNREGYSQELQDNISENIRRHEVDKAGEEDNASMVASQKDDTQELQDNIDENIRKNEVDLMDNQVNKAGDEDDASMVSTQKLEDNAQELEDNIDENIRKDEVEKACDEGGTNVAATENRVHNTQELQDNINENMRKDEVVTIDPLDFFLVDNQVERTGDENDASVASTQPIELSDDKLDDNTQLDSTVIPAESEKPTVVDLESELEEFIASYEPVQTRTENKASLSQKEFDSIFEDPILESNTGVSKKSEVNVEKVNKPLIEKPGPSMPDLGAMMAFDLNDSMTNPSNSKSTDKEVSSVSNAEEPSLADSSNEFLYCIGDPAISSNRDKFGLSKLNQIERDTNPGNDVEELLEFSDCVEETEEVVILNSTTSTRISTELVNKSAPVKDYKLPSMDRTQNIIIDVLGLEESLDNDESVSQGKINRTVVEESDSSSEEPGISLIESISSFDESLEAEAGVVNVSKPAIIRNLSTSLSENSEDDKDSDIEILFEEGPHDSNVIEQDDTAFQSAIQDPLSEIEHVDLINEDVMVSGVPIENEEVDCTNNNSSAYASFDSRESELEAVKNKVCSQSLSTKLDSQEEMFPEDFEDVHQLEDSDVLMGDGNVEMESSSISGTSRRGKSTKGALKSFTDIPMSTPNLNIYEEEANLSVTNDIEVKHITINDCDDESGSSTNGEEPKSKLRDPTSMSKESILELVSRTSSRIVLHRVQLKELPEKIDSSYTKENGSFVSTEAPSFNRSSYSTAFTEVSDCESGKRTPILRKSNVRNSTRRNSNNSPNVILFPPDFKDKNPHFDDTSEDTTNLSMHVNTSYNQRSHLGVEEDYIPCVGLNLNLNIFEEVTNLSVAGETEVKHITINECHDESGSSTNCEEQKSKLNDESSYNTKAGESTSELKDRTIMSRESILELVSRKSLKIVLHRLHLKGLPVKRNSSNTKKRESYVSTGEGSFNASRHSTSLVGLKDSKMEKRTPTSRKSNMEIFVSTRRNSNNSPNVIVLPPNLEQKNQQFNDGYEDVTKLSKLNTSCNQSSHFGIEVDSDEKSTRSPTVKLTGRVRRKRAGQEDICENSKPSVPEIVTVLPKKGKSSAKGEIEAKEIKEIKCSPKLTGRRGRTNTTKKPENISLVDPENDYSEVSNSSLKSKSTVRGTRKRVVSEKSVPTVVEIARTPVIKGRRGVKKAKVEFKEIEMREVSVTLTSLRNVSRTRNAKTEEVSITVLDDDDMDVSSPLNVKSTSTSKRTRKRAVKNKEVSPSKPSKSKKVMDDSSSLSVKYMSTSGGTRKLSMKGPDVLPPQLNSEKAIDDSDSDSPNVKCTSTSREIRKRAVKAITILPPPKKSKHKKPLDDSDSDSSNVKSTSPIRGTRKRTMKYIETEVLPPPKKLNSKKSMDDSDSDLSNFKSRSSSRRTRNRTLKDSEILPPKESKSKKFIDDSSSSNVKSMPTRKRTVKKIDILPSSKKLNTKNDVDDSDSESTNVKSTPASRKTTKQAVKNTEKEIFPPSKELKSKKDKRTPPKLIKTPSPRKLRTRPGKKVK